ncbi:MAG: hypothetical protein U5L45_06675 [Saprospiraceae bacterium]|nr:hypothetical protein [Saprospiraceae bacterium]
MPKAGASGNGLSFDCDFTVGLVSSYGVDSNAWDAQVPTRLRR